MAWKKGTVIQDDAVFWTIYEGVNRLRRVGNVGGRWYYLLFTTEGRARKYYDAKPKTFCSFKQKVVDAISWKDLLALTSAERFPDQVAVVNLKPEDDSIEPKNVVRLECKQL